MLKAEAGRLLRRIEHDGLHAELVYREDDYSPWVVRVTVGAVTADFESPRQWAVERDRVLACKVL